jgi:hypothetical protein
MFAIGQFGIPVLDDFCGGQFFVERGGEGFRERQVHFRARKWNARGMKENIDSYRWTKKNKELGKWMGEQTLFRDFFFERTIPL